EGANLDEIKLAWFDHWLKGIDTGITDTDRPFRVIDADGSSYRMAAFPSEAASVRRLHLSPQKRLTEQSVAGTNQQVWFKGVSLACSQAINQWGAGAFQAFVDLCHAVPGVQQLLDLLQPGDATWETEPLAEPLRLSGPASLTLHATSNRPETMFVAEVYDVAPRRHPEAADGRGAAGLQARDRPGLQLAGGGRLDPAVPPAHRGVGAEGAGGHQLPLRHRDPLGVRVRAGRAPGAAEVEDRRHPAPAAATDEAGRAGRRRLQGAA